jgi:hypothetical protein
MTLVLDPGGFLISEKATDVYVIVMGILMDYLDAGS